MGDSAICVVALSVGASGAAKRAKEVARWLLDRGIVRANSARDELRRPSEYVPGPKAADACPHVKQLKGLGNNGVDVVVGRTPFDAGGNTEPAACPKCHAAVELDQYMDLIEPWLEGEEPMLACHQCGASHLLGDYEGDFSVLVSELAVRFNNWGELRPEFLAELKQRLGPRTRVVHQSI